MNGSKKSLKRFATYFCQFLTVLRKGLLFNEKTLEEEPLWIAPNKEGKLPSSLYKHTLFKSQFQKSVIAMLSYPLLQEQYKSVLMILHKRIIPYMSQPQSLMDF